jgi:hypothetical protein
MRMIRDRLSRQGGKPVIQAKFARAIAAGNGVLCGTAGEWHRDPVGLCAEG